MNEFIDWGQPIEALDRAIHGHEFLLPLLAACEAHPDFRVVGLQKVDALSGGLIIVDAGNGTVPSRSPTGIERVERLALTYNEYSAIPYEVRPLRRDFPETLHQNLVLPGEPRSLCLYDQGWQSIQRWWTPQKFLNRILEWLEGTAAQTLHSDDQSLEQLFYGSGLQLILPHDFREIKDSTTTLEVDVVHEHPTRKFVLTKYSSKTPPGNFRKLSVLEMTLPRIKHPPVYAPPRSLGGLADYLSKHDSSLFPLLTDAIRHAAHKGLETDGIDSNSMTVILVRVPRIRSECIERIDVWAFISDVSPVALGIELQVLQKLDNRAFPFETIGSPAAATPAAGKWRDIELDPMDVRTLPSRSVARSLAGVSEENAEFFGTIAGAGALGCSIVDAWARAGWGKWDIIDEDFVEPHNVIRHTADSRSVGLPKATVVHGLTSSRLGERSDGTSGIHQSATAFSDQALLTSLQRARLLVDATATIEVSREWSSKELGRIVSVFITPTGFASVMLFEDAGGQIRVPSIEAQYYRAVLREEWGQEHLAAPATLVRVGRGCRDRSFVISPEIVSLHAATLARRIRLGVNHADAQIAVWLLDDNSGALVRHAVPVRDVRSQRCGKWMIFWDSGLEDELQKMRIDALPTETGGALVGVVDHKLLTIHIVDAWSAPLDSKASPTSFTRGMIGLRDAREDCMRRTSGMVDYVGDWHSHPSGCSSRPSVTDMVLLADLAQTLSEDGVPVVMAIVGDKGVGVSLGEAWDQLNSEQTELPESAMVVIGVDSTA